MIRHTVDEEPLFGILASIHALLHRVFEKLDGDFHGHDRPFLDVGLDHLAEITAWAVLLLTQQVTGREVLEAIVRHQLLALGAFARSRPAEDEDESDV